MIDRKVRDDFIGLDRKIFFNNASYAPMLKCVKQAIDDYIEEACRLKGGADDQTESYLQQLRESSAKLIGARPEEIGFAINTSYGINLGAQGLDLKAGDEVILADNDFPSVIYPFKVFEDRGVVLKYSPSVDRNFSLDECRKLITQRTRILALSYVQYFNGYRNNLKAIGDFCNERDIFFLVDGIQGVGVCPLDVNECHIDLLACGAQKWLLSPIGSGFFYLSENAKYPLRSCETGWMGVDWELKYDDLMHFDNQPFSDARRFTLGTYPRLPLWGMAPALQYILNLGVENIFRHNLALMDRLIEYIKQDDYYFFMSSLVPQHRSQIMTIGSPAGAALHKHLLKEGIYLVYREGGVRVAVNFYNTFEEVDFLIEKLEEFKKM